MTGSDGIDYETAKRLASSADDGERRFVASQAATKPEILYLLASDRNPAVRREIARNLNTPRHADLMLSTDPDDDVRGNLAGKIAALAPSLTPDRIGQIERMTLEILETLARDQAVAVRRVVAEAVKELPNTSPELARVVQELARDLELSVSGPVLRSSPILTDEDLLAIIQAAPMDDRLVAIAERAGVSAGVSDAIARTESETAVAALLGNHSAQIREETLDRLVEMAPRHEPWHGPLVRRPALPARAAQRLAGFVASQLVRVLETRTDLPAQTRKAITQAVKQNATAAHAAAGLAAAEEEEEKKERPIDRAKRLQKENKLTEDAIDSALTQGDRGFVMAALSVRSAIPLDIVGKIIGGQSARAVTALCWKAKVSMRFCRQIQLRLAQIPPSGVINARSGTDYPMNEAELKWQLEFFGVKG
jgi:uncharacterized protein (DUF2336 family)